jgi:hypothetical protein
MLRTIIPALALLFTTALCRAQSAFVCEKEGDFADPDNCQGFITCVSNRDTIEATVNECPASLQWNEKLGECDYEDGSTCGADD